MCTAPAPENWTLYSISLKRNRRIDISPTNINNGELVIKKARGGNQSVFYD